MSTPGRRASASFPLSRAEDADGGEDELEAGQHLAPKRDKASQILGVPVRNSAITGRTSMMSTRSMPAYSTPSYSNTAPLTSLYVVSGLPKSPQTWTLADPDVTLGLLHSDGAVNRWWRAEVLGSTVSPGVGGSRKKRGKVPMKDDAAKGAGNLSKHDIAKMLSKTLKLSFTREVEIIVSTLQPASTVHTFTFTLPAPSSALAPPSTVALSALRSSVLTQGTDNNRYTHGTSSYGTFPYSYMDGRLRPSSAYLGPTNVQTMSQSNIHLNTEPNLGGAGSENRGAGSVTYHGVCLTVWSHADGERSAAIRRTLEAARLRKESAQSLVASRVKSFRSEADAAGPARKGTRSRRGPWTSTDGETDADSDIEGGAISESDFDIASTVGHGPGESTLFLPCDTVFWLPYALTLVSRYPIYDLMRDYLTLSWARFSKDVASHTMQISRILSHPAPRPGDLVRLDASPKDSNEKSDSSVEVVTRFPGALDFGKGLVDINFTMWPLFKCLSIDNILTICEIAVAPTGRILFFSKHPAMLGIAVATIKYLVELRGWNGIALPSVHSRDAKIYVEDPGPWIIGLAAELRYSIRTTPEVCVVDLDINYLSCASPPPGYVSSKQQRERYRQRLLPAFGEFYHPDHSIPIEFKEAFPAGRFRPLCKIQAKRGGSSSIIAESIKPPEWWNSTKIIQAFDAVLQDKLRKPSLFKRLSSFRTPRRPTQLTAAEQQVQHSLRKRAIAFVDARDDLETKIGRLSRRLNFLVTESDLWRDKFVTFEQYAEKLSNEATELRGKIGKEQRESRRLTGIISLSAAEKLKLQTQLQQTEAAHKDAMTELESMRLAMEKMEEERAQLVAEVEAQIEKALASMMVDFTTESEYGSRPQSPASLQETSHRPSITTTLYSEGGEGSGIGGSGLKEDVEGEEEQDDKEREKGNGRTRGKSVSGEKGDRATPSMSSVGGDGPSADEDMAENANSIAKKVLEIQQKLEFALTGRTDPSDRSSQSAWDDSMSEQTAHADSPGTITSRLNTKTHTKSQGDLKHNHDRMHLTLSKSLSADDSDTDFQSAYSASPRDSYGETVQSLNMDEIPPEEDEEGEEGDDAFDAKIAARGARGRVHGMSGGGKGMYAGADLALPSMGAQTRERASSTATEVPYRSNH